MEIINHQFKVICDSQRDSLAAHKESLLYCKWKAKKAEVLIQNWMIKLAEFWSRLNSKIGNSTMSRPKPGFSKSGIGMSRFMHLKFLSTQILLTVLGLLVVVYSSLLKTSIPPLLEDNAETCAFQHNTSFSRSTPSCMDLQWLKMSRIHEGSPCNTKRNITC